MEVNEIFDNIDRRLYELEQILTSQYGPTNTYGQILIVPPGGGTPVTLDLTASPATALVVTPGTFFDRTFCDVSWTAPVDGSAAAFDVEWAKRNGTGPYTYEVVNASRVHGNSFRIEGLDPGKWYGVRVTGVNRIGLMSTSLPATGYQDFQAPTDASAPAAPAGLVVVSTIKGIIARINPNSEQDVAWGKGTYRFELSTNSSFTAIIKTNNEGGVVSYFPDLAGNTTYWVRAMAIDSSGNASAPTTGVSATTSLVQGSGGGGTSDVGGTLTANEVFAGSMTTAIFTANTVNADRLLSNSADVAKLKTSDLTTQTITLNGGAFIAGSPPTTGLLINSQGIRLYNAGSQTITLDAASGTATFTGTVNATSGTLSNLNVTGYLNISTGQLFTNGGAGTHITISSASSNEISFYTGNASETNRGSIQVGNSGYLTIQAPTFSGYNAPYISLLYNAMNLGNSARLNATLRDSGNDDFWNNCDFHALLSAHDKISTVGDIHFGNNYGGGLFANSGSSNFGGDPNWGYAVRSGSTYAGIGYASTRVTELRYYSQGANDWAYAGVMVDMRTNTIVAGCSNNATFAYLSSRGIKTRIKTLKESSLEGLIQLRPVSHGLRKHGKNKYVGLVSQEVGKVWPDAVVGEGENATGIVPAAMFARLVHSAQEQQAVIKSLEERVNILESHLIAA